jgi:hypothetical protein
MPKRYIRMVQKPSATKPELSTEAEVTLQSRGESRGLAAKLEAGGRLQKLKVDTTSAATPQPFIPDGAETAVGIEKLPNNTLAAMFDEGRVHAGQGLIYTEVMGSVDTLELAPHKLYENTYDEIMSTLVNMWRVMHVHGGLIKDPSGKMAEYKPLVQDLLVQMQTMGKLKYDAAKAKYQAVYKSQYKVLMAKTPKPTPRKAALAAASKAMSAANKQAPGFRNFHATIWANRKKINATVFSISMTPSGGGTATDVPLSIYNAGLMLERTVAAGKEVMAAHKANVAELQAKLSTGTSGALAAKHILKDGAVEYEFKPDEPLVIMALNAEASKTPDGRYKSVRNRVVADDAEYEALTGGVTSVPDTYGEQRAGIRATSLVLEEALNEPIPGTASDISATPSTWKSTSTVEVAVSGLRFRKAANNSAKHRSLKKGEKLTFVTTGATAPTPTNVAGIDFYEVKDASGTKGFVAFKNKAGKQYFKVKDVTSAPISDY